MQVDSKKMKSEHDRNRHARSRSKQPRNTIFLQVGQSARVGREEAARGKAPTIGSATSRLGSSTSTQPCKDAAGISIE